MQEKSVEKFSQVIRLKNLRVTQQLTWRQVAELLGVTPSMIYQVVAGKRRLSDKVLWCLENAELALGLVSVHDAASRRSFFAQNLLLLMEESGTRQDMLADELGISQTAISKCLKGRIPRAEVLVDLGNFFGGYEVGELLYRDLSLSKPKWKGHESAGTGSARPTVARLNQRLSRLRDERAEQIAKALLEMLNVME